eukprot:5116119-Alexandrium_andersonii.AAC.1
MSASLVGSEMCIRDRPPGPRLPTLPSAPDKKASRPVGLLGFSLLPSWGCLLYTSDAADDM